MRNVIKIAALGLALGGFASAASAAPEGVSIAVSAELAKECKFAEGSVSAVVSNDERVYTNDLSYTCNFPGDLKVYLSAENGSLVSAEDPANKARYNINFASTIAGDGSNWFPAEDIAGEPEQSGLVNTAVPGEEATIKLGIYLRDTLRVAGHYSDTVSVTLAP